MNRPHPQLVQEEDQHRRVARRKDGETSASTMTREPALARPWLTPTTRLDDRSRVTTVVLVSGSVSEALVLPSRPGPRSTSRRTSCRTPPRASPRPSDHPREPCKTAGLLRLLLDPLALAAGESLVTSAGGRAPTPSSALSRARSPARLLRRSGRAVCASTNAVAGRPEGWAQWRGTASVGETCFRDPRSARPTSGAGASRPQLRRRICRNGQSRRGSEASAQPAVVRMV